MGIFDSIKRLLGIGKTPVQDGLSQTIPEFKYSRRSGEVVGSGSPTVPQNGCANQSPRLPIDDPALALLKANELVKGGKELISSREVNVKTSDSGATAKLPQNPFKGV
ncbi:hypothetical protein JW962_03620 [Candidatus Dojkabacteria bacterium]|nr:hypothetical protein [Candidatus Dojkabacteria bacterium]